MNRRDAALHLARRYPGGIEAIAPRMGKRPDTLRKELTGADGYKWGVDDEELLIAMCAAAGVPDHLAPITVAALNAGALLIPLPQTMDGDHPTFKCLADAAQDFGEFVSTAAGAMADGSVSANELKAVEREFAELVARGQVFVASMAAQHRDARPACIRPGSKRA